MECLDVGSTNPDIAGLGILLAFAIQGFISLVLSFWSAGLRSMFEEDPQEDVNSKENYRLLRGHLDKVLATASDTQTLTGIALLVSALVQTESLDLYHYHVIYDTVNFTAVSFCAAMLCTFGNEEERKVSRYVEVAIFAALYLVFCIIFGRHLEDWNWTGSGTCYNTMGVASPYSSHPYVDRIYLGITCFYMFFAILCATTFNGTEFTAAKSRTYHRHRDRFAVLLVRFRRFACLEPILSLAMVQYPVHMYSVFALRAANQHLLGGESENTWGFGQIVALIMVGQTLIELIRNLRGLFLATITILSNSRGIADGRKEYQEERHNPAQARDNSHELITTDSHG